MLTYRVRARVEGAYELVLSNQIIVSDHDGLWQTRSSAAEQSRGRSSLCCL